MRATQGDGASEQPRNPPLSCEEYAKLVDEAITRLDDRAVTSQLDAEDREWLLGWIERAKRGSGT